MEDEEERCGRGGGGREKKKEEDLEDNFDEAMEKVDRRRWLTEGK